MKGLILGAGVTGLAAAQSTKYPIYEATDKVGGICRSYTVNGYRFENGGGHWIFGEPKIIEFINTISYSAKYTRKSGVYINQIFPCPIQDYFKYSEEIGGDCLKRWLYENFSSDLCRLFFFPFNQKYTDGLMDKVIQDDPKKSPSYGKKSYNDTFVYPALGLDHFVDKFANGKKIKFFKKAQAVNVDKRIILFTDGTEEKYDRLISTIPLSNLLKMCGYKEYSLPHTSVLVLNIGAEKGPNCPKEHWLYIPGDDSEFFRVGFYSNVHPSFAPDGKVSLYVERAFAGADNFGPDYPIEVIEQLQSWGWIGEAEVVKLSYIPCAYTWLYPESERQEYLDWLKGYGIESIGRYGRWRFQGIAESIADGLSLCA